MCSKHEVILQNHFEWEINGKPIFSVLHHVSSRGPDLEKTVFNHGLYRNTFPLRIEFAPARHTMDIHLNFCPRQLIELIPCPAFFLLYFSPNTESPGGGIKVWHRPIMKHWEFECQ